MESVAVWQSQSHEPPPFLVMEISTPMVYQLPIKVGWQRRWIAVDVPLLLGSDSVGARNVPGRLDVHGGKTSWHLPAGYIWIYNFYEITNWRNNKMKQHVFLLVLFEGYKMIKMVSQRNNANPPASLSVLGAKLQAFGPSGPGPFVSFRFLRSRPKVHSICGWNPWFAGIGRQIGHMWRGDAQNSFLTWLNRLWRFPRPIYVHKRICIYVYYIYLDLQRLKINCLFRLLPSFQ